jgi:hypothetical protein
MPKLTYKTCRECGRHTDEAGPLSHTRLCEVCSYNLLTENVIGLATRSGPALARWRRGMAASVGAVLLDDYRDKP